MSSSAPSFASLKEKRKGTGTRNPAASVPSKNGEETPGSSLSRHADSDARQVQDLYPELDLAVMEVRTSKTAGRSLFAMRAVPPGTVLLRVRPHLAILDKSHLSILCSNCMLDKPEMQEPLRRCSACKAVYYCSVTCQRADWVPDRHKLECQRLQDWARLVKAAGRPSHEQVPDSPVRALGRLLLLKAQRGEQWWQQVIEMAESPANKEEAMLAVGEANLEPELNRKEDRGSLALAVTQYLVGPAAVNSLFPGMDAKQITRTLLSLVDQFGVNSFSLTLPDLSNIGVAICPTVALINHSCQPNCTVVFPDGPSGDMQVVAFKGIGKGEEILSSYVDITTTRSQRQADLVQQYGFMCHCPTCMAESDTNNVTPRQSLRCLRDACGGLARLPNCEFESGSVEVVCNTCQAKRPIAIDRENQEKLGLKWAMQQAKVFSDIKEPAGFAALSSAKLATFEVLLYQLKHVHRMHPASQPLLSLNQAALQSTLANDASPLISDYASNRYGRAAALCREVVEGFERIFEYGHPVRAIQQAVLARLMSIAADGGEVKDDLVLLLAYEQLKKARGEMELAFGRKGMLLEQLGQNMRDLERDLELRRRVRNEL